MLDFLMRRRQVARTAKERPKKGAQKKWFSPARLNSNEIEWGAQISRMNSNKMRLPGFRSNELEWEVEFSRMNSNGELE